MTPHVRAVRRTAEGLSASSRVRRCLWSFAMIAVAGTALAGAGERLARRYDWRVGQPVNFIVALVQDSRGFIWSLSTVGLVRFDGTEMTVWDDRPFAPLPGCASAAAGWPFLIHIHDRTLWRAREEGGVDPVPGPDGQTPYLAYRAGCAPDGSLYAGDAQGRYHRLAPGGAWSEATSPDGLGDGVQALWPGEGDEVLAVTEKGLFRMERLRS